MLPTAEAYKVQGKHDKAEKCVWLKLEGTMWHLQTITGKYTRLGKKPDFEGNLLC